MSKNKKSLQQIALACKHFHEMRNVGVSENHAIRTLELFCDVYAKVVTDGTSIPHRPKKIPFLNWSNRALEARYENPDLKTQGNLVVEHGTPRREFARLVLKLYDSERLDENKLNNLVRKKWKAERRKTRKQEPIIDE